MLKLQHFQLKHIKSQVQLSSKLQNRLRELYSLLKPGFTQQTLHYLYEWLLGIFRV